MTASDEELSTPRLFLDTNIILDVLWARETGDDPADCINVAVAKLNGSMVFVTKDTTLIRRIESQLSGYIEAVRPVHVDEVLRSFGVEA